jgi:hypothetical protein
MKTKLLLALVLLVGTSAAFAGPRVFFGFGFGGYYPPPVAVYTAPPPPPAYYAAPVAPGYGYSWIGGYYYPVGARWAWHSGYWARPPYAGAFWVGPRYYGGHYYAGYWGRRR